MQNWERAANRTAINKHKECQGSKWNGSVWAEGFLINSSALWGRDGLHSIKAKAVRPLLHTRHNTQPHPVWKSHAFPVVTKGHWWNLHQHWNITTNTYTLTSTEQPKMSHESYFTPRSKEIINAICMRKSLFWTEFKLYYLIYALPRFSWWYTIIKILYIYNSPQCDI